MVTFLSGRLCDDADGIESVIGNLNVTLLT